MTEDSNIYKVSQMPPLKREVWRGLYTLHLADNSLIMGHRLSEWTGHGPMLEQDIAISNIALDLIGQSRNFYQYAAQLINTSEASPTGGGLEGASEDSLAYLREAREYKNLLITELPNGDWAKTILKLFFFSSYQYFLYQRLINSTDKQLSAIAEKSFKEVTYHVRWSSDWVIRLGDGTNESHNRMNIAFEELWSYTGEMFISADYEIDCIENNIGVDVRTLKDSWVNKVTEVLQEATLLDSLNKVQSNNWMQTGGKHGKHTEHLGFILAEMQYLQRTYPGCKW